MAFDILSIPGISTEVERIFLQAKKLITDERNRLQKESVEASKYQKNWQLRGLI
jgi:hAT family C-terminal dimerisation region